MALIIDIKVVPQSGMQQATLDESGMLKIRLKSAPEGGKANVELIKFLSKQLKIKQDAIEIVLGTTSRKKRLKIDIDRSEQELIALLGIERQLKIR